MARRKILTIGALVATVCAVLMWSRVVCRRALAANAARCPHATQLHVARYDQLATASRLRSDGRPITADHVARIATLEAAQFAASGNTYRHYALPAVEPACLERASCFEDEREHQWSALIDDLGAVRSDATPLLQSQEQTDQELEALERRVVARVLHLNGSRQLGRADAPKRIWALSSGQPSDRLRDHALAQFVRSFDDVRVDEIDAASALRELGDRLTATIVFDGRIYKDVTRYDQLVEIVEPQHVVPVSSRAGQSLVDAHMHMMPDGAAHLLGILDSNRVGAALVTPLPQDTHYLGLREANERVLAVARENTGRIVPFVMISPLDADPRGELERYRAAGARGVKLISGHGAYFHAAGELPLDDYKMRALFRYCEEESIPILWHVNSDLYGQGFLRVLHDFPSLTVINPHIAGYLGDSPTLVRELLQRYPNLNIDLSFGDQSLYVRRSLEELSLRHDEWRQLLIDDADRFLFGTDLVIGANASIAHANAVYELLTAMLESSHYDFDYSAPSGYSTLAAESHHRANLNGLALPAEVLHKLYVDNAARLYGFTAPAAY